MRPIDYEPPSKRKKTEFSIGRKVFMGELIIWGGVIILGAVVFGILVVWDWFTR